ncbi:Acetyl xylan esterase [Streptomyces microflavus DSM 40593]|uniref:Acetyl xylan esterase n=1 Tax=Streptomyces microflavus DSM 40593 TaxID=1303692 RepID=N0D1T1_STRMI|nr:acetylxylan esterase [Streptomyces microflavus]AGK79803.1 Acetyl xylan esterase [Streptomyces microflavus DSM 40593]
MASPVAFAHDFPFDPAYGCTAPDQLLGIPAPPAPADFEAFWRDRYARARAVSTRPVLGPVEEERDGVRIHGITYTSVGGVRLGGWLALPAEGPVRYGFVVGHGYGGRQEPGRDLPPLPGAAAILPCVRGMGERGRVDSIPDLADEHVLYGIGSRDSYVIGECVADLWCAASALTEVVPELAGAGHLGGPRLGYLGESFGGGLGALALPWDDRFGAAQLTVPTFGNHPLRLTLPCVGSGEAVRAHHREHPEAADVLRYFDAATAATRLELPTLVAAALFDPSVPPPGQFAVYNALAGERELQVLSAGHFPYRGMTAEAAELDANRTRFFGERLTAADGSA